MPAPQVNPEVMNMSVSGQFLAVGGNATQFGEEGTKTPGLQVFRFNGANPIVLYSNRLTSDPINEIHWDNTDHLYALSNSTHKLYVYSVTSSSITAAPGSPFIVPSSPNALSVVPLLCSAPASGWRPHLRSLGRFQRRFASAGCCVGKSFRDARPHGGVGGRGEEVHRQDNATEFRAEVGCGAASLRGVRSQHRRAEVEQHSVCDCEVREQK